jgi:hypothetical protein
MVISSLPEHSSAQATRELSIWVEGQEPIFTLTKPERSGRANQNEAVKSCSRLASEVYLTGVDDFTVALNARALVAVAGAGALTE